MDHRISSMRRPAVHIVTLLLAVLMVGACGGSIETDLTLYTGDRFEATSRITVPTAGLALVGGTAAIDAQFQELEQQSRAEGAEFSWRKEKSRSSDEAVYTVSTSGTSYGDLSSLDIQVQKVQYEGKDALSVSADPSYDMYGTTNTLRLHVGKILETSNARSGSNTILWTGAESLEAIVIPKTATNWLVISIVILGIAAAALISFVVLRNRPAARTAPATRTAPMAAKRAFCPHCGKPTQPGAKFCMGCGHFIPPRRF